jgi:hypothetical protein
MGRCDIGPNTIFVTMFGYCLKDLGDDRLKVVQVNVLDFLFKSQNS